MNRSYILLSLRWAVGLTLLLYAVAASAQYKMTTDEYVRTYKPLAVESMQKYGIPASITIAQGLLESGNGGSRLAVKANNHFGIKCKSSWTGGRIYHDDDEKGECFRKYKSAEESYLDHARFLVESPRYAELFKLSQTDYQGWARGLKAAGYATNPRYAELLIDLIERNDLHQLDGEEPRRGGLLVRRQERKEERAELNDQVPPKHAVDRCNGVRYVISSPVESYVSLAAQYDLRLKRLLKYNDLSSDRPLTAGTRVYIEPKRSRVTTGERIHEMSSGETYYSIAQQYGLTLKALQKMNPQIRTTRPSIGLRLRLK